MAVDITVMIITKVIDSTDNLYYYYVYFIILLFLVHSPGLCWVGGRCNTFDEI